MAKVSIDQSDAAELQENLLWFLSAGCGPRLPRSAVRAAMLLRVNSHLRGLSGVRWELINRLVLFLNEGVTPHVTEYGSIGASGDLVPMAKIAGAICGLDASFTVDYKGGKLEASTALSRLGLKRLPLLPKEGLAMVNGTPVMTGIAALCVHDVRALLALSLGAHALMIQALGGATEPFRPFVHAHKPHPGQIWAAAAMSDLLRGSRLTDMGKKDESGSGHAVQDRYSIRCLPQYFGPIIEGITHIGRQVEIEINSVTDNPLIDAPAGLSYHCGNFLGEHIGVAMDHLRYYIGLIAKHLDIQIALLVTPSFSNGLAPSLVGNTSRAVNMGLKGLQLTGNSVMPLLTFFGNSLADRYPTHAEQFNQNLNSQGFGSANLARQSIELMQNYLAVALMFGVQAADLRTYKTAGHYDATECLSPATTPLYEAVRQVIGSPPSRERPHIWNDNEQVLEHHIALVLADIQSEGRTIKAIQSIVGAVSDLTNHRDGKEQCLVQ